jgi:hypothetical protein
VTLVESLQERQRTLGLTDTDFATMLDMSRPMWSLVRSGKRRLGPDALGAIMRRFPELASDCLIYLRDSAAGSGGFAVPKNVTDGDDIPVTETAVEAVRS